MGHPRRGEDRAGVGFPRHPHRDRGIVAAVATRRRARPTSSPPTTARAPRSYEALLADPEIDAVYIPLPNSAHVEWTLKALEAGKHVLTEKPIALHAEEIDALIAARDRAGKLAAEAFMVTHHPQWLRAKELVQGGAIGRLRQVQAAFNFNNATPPNIRNDPPSAAAPCATSASTRR